MAAHASSAPQIDDFPPIGRASVGRQDSRATIFTMRAEPIGVGFATVRPLADGWTATLSALDRPGALTSAYFAGGLREVVMHLADGWRAAARITGTSFSADNQRVFELRGIDPFV